MGVFHISRADDHEETTKDSVYEIYSQDRIMSPLSKPVYFFIYPSTILICLFIQFLSIALYTANVSGMIYHAKSHSQITTVIVSKVRDDELQMSNVLGPEYGGQTICITGMFQKVFQCKKNIPTLLGPDDSMVFLLELYFSLLN